MTYVEFIRECELLGFTTELSNRLDSSGSIVIHYKGKAFGSVCLNYYGCIIGSSSDLDANTYEKASLLINNMRNTNLEKRGEIGIALQAKLF